MLVIIPAIILIIFLVLLVKQHEKNKEIKKLKREVYKLKKANLGLETNQLKFQLQPHTLNNILANLNVFAKRLNKGMESLSDTLEYIFYKNDVDFVSIQDEVDFMRKYLDLNDLFLSEIDAIEIDDSKLNTHEILYTKPCIPHLISAYFLENAFKHGDTKHPHFLKIQLLLSEGCFEMKVINKIKPRKTQTNPGIGLENMKRRLSILMEGKHDVKFTCNEEEYCATITFNL